MEREKRELNEQLVEIEQRICDFFALPYDEVFSKNLRRDLVLARHFTIYILHKHYDISLNKLSFRYICSRRNIEITCANIDFYIKHDKKYSNYYRCLMQYIKKGE